jgi:hypothetical protein
MCHPSVLPIVVGDSRHGCMEKMTVMMNSHRFPVHDHREPRFLVKNLQILKRCSMTTVHDYFAHIAHLSLSQLSSFFSPKSEAVAASTRPSRPDLRSARDVIVSPSSGRRDGRGRRGGGPDRLHVHRANCQGLPPPRQRDPRPQGTPPLREALAPRHPVIEQEHTCKGEEGKEESRYRRELRQMCRRRDRAQRVAVEDKCHLQPPALSPSAAAALSLSQEKSRGSACPPARLFSSASPSRLVSGPWERRKGREWIGFLSGLA